MGEARRKADADALGLPRPRDARCPACGSRAVHDMPTAALRAASPTLADSVTCDWQGCLDCKAVWEPFPPLTVRDPVCAEPCDNCAFRPGSPEQADPERWRELMRSLKSPDPESGRPGGWFYCHKGVPIDLAKGPGNFLFPQRPLTMDGKVVRNPDGSPVMTWDVAKMRSCSGYLRMLWATKHAREGREHASEG